MSTAPKNTSRSGNAKGPSYTPASAERQLEKKLAAAERDRKLLTEHQVNGLEVRLNEKELGKGAMILHIGQQGGFTAQVVIHRAIGESPSGPTPEWILSNKTQLGNLIGQKNPFYQKTRERVSNLKLEHALSEGVLEKNSDGKVCYPDKTIREEALEKCRMYHDIHKNVQGGVPMNPIFCYGTSSVFKQEMAYLNSLAESKELKAAIDKEASSYRMHEIKDPVTGQRQIPMSWAEGIPKEFLPEVLMEVITTGSYDAGKWDSVKVFPEVKADPFTLWGYHNGDIPQDKLAPLLEALQGYGKLLKEYNAVNPQGQKAKDAETVDQRATRLAKHEALQKTAKLVNGVEKFPMKLPKHYVADFNLKV